MTPFAYITSANYSGSTLLTFLLNAHPAIVTIGELKGAAKDPDTHLCSCGKPIGHCAFWSEIVERLHKQGVMFDHRDVWSQCGYRIPDASFANRVVSHRYRGGLLELARRTFINLSPACRRHFARIDRTNEAFAEAALATSDRQVFLDGSKDPNRLAYLKRLTNLQIKVIYMIRDGRGVMNSMMKRLKCTPEVAAAEWVAREGEIRKLLPHFPAVDQIMIRYEDLCGEPDATMERIFSFLGVDPDAATRDFRAVSHHILGNAMRFESTSEIKLDTKWKNTLTPDQLAVFERIGGGLNRQYGYGPDGEIGPAPDLP